jgi:hypothetical protein
VALRAAAAMALTSKERKKAMQARKFSKFFRVGDRVRHLDQNRFGVVAELAAVVDQGLPPKVFINWDGEDAAQKKRNRASATENLELVTQEAAVDDVWGKLEFTEDQKAEFLSMRITKLQYGPEQATEAAEKLAELGLDSPLSSKWRIQNSSTREVKGYVSFAEGLNRDDLRHVNDCLLTKCDCSFSSWHREDGRTRHKTYQCKCGIPPVSARIKAENKVRTWFVVA